jgi:hypothetical protein
MADPNPLLQPMTAQMRDEIHSALVVINQHALRALKANNESDRLQLAACLSGVLGEVVILLEEIASVRQAEF